MKFPEWVIPEEVDLDQLRVQCETALVTYMGGSTVLHLCTYAYRRGFAELHETLRVTLSNDNRLILETVIEDLNNLPHLSLGRDWLACSQRRVIWLKQLKEKLDECQ